MSEMLIAKLRQGYERANAQGFDAVLEMAHPDFTTSGGPMEELSGTKIDGIETFAAWQATMDESWDEITFHAEELIDFDDHQAIAWVRMDLRGRGSGIEVEGHSAHLWTEKDGLIARLDVLSSVDEAMALAQRRASVDADAH